MGKIRGYNFNAKLGDKLIRGVTDSDLSIDADWVETINKDNQGVEDLEFEKANSTFNVNFEWRTLETGEEGTYLGSEDLMEAAHNGTIFAAVVGRVATTGAKVISGNAVITSYKDTTGSKEFATASCAFRFKGATSITTVS